MKSFSSCIVVGAGISGLLAATRLQRDGIQVTILEKGRGFGGRMASRRFEKAVFDHGAQFVTTREASFRELVEGWMGEGLARPWYKGPLGNMRYVGVNGMNTVPKALGGKLNVFRSEKVTRLKFEKGRWVVFSDLSDEEGKVSKKRHEAEYLILTAPVPQSLKLLQESNIDLDYDEEEELSRITYTKCITAMVQLNGPAGLPNPGAMDLNHPVLRWIGDNSLKNVSPVPGSITINSSPKFAERFWDASDEERLPVLMDAARPFIKADVVNAVGHRWGFSDPVRIYREKEPFRKPYYIDSEYPFALCGDGFGGARIEAAAISGMQLAEKLVRPI